MVLYRTCSRASKTGCEGSGENNAKGMYHSLLCTYDPIESLDLCKSQLFHQQVAKLSSETLSVL